METKKEGTPDVPQEQNQTLLPDTADVAPIESSRSEKQDLKFAPEVQKYNTPAFTLRSIKDDFFRRHYKGNMDCSLDQEFYVVFRGKEPGIYDDLFEAQRQLVNCNEPKYKSYPNIKYAVTALYKYKVDVIDDILYVGKEKDLTQVFPDKQQYAKLIDRIGEPMLLSMGGGISRELYGKTAIRKQQRGIICYETTFREFGLDISDLPVGTDIYAITDSFVRVGYVFIINFADGSSTTNQVFFSRPYPYQSGKTGSYIMGANNIKFKIERNICFKTHYLLVGTGYNQFTLYSPQPGAYPESDENKNNKNDKADNQNKNGTDDSLDDLINSL